MHTIAVLNIGIIWQSNSNCENTKTFPRRMLRCGIEEKNVDCYEDHCVTILVMLNRAF